MRLTSAEAGLLSALSAEPGSVLSRGELTRRCAIDGGERAIDVQVTRLRRKIEPDPRVPQYLQTVAGADTYCARIREPNMPRKDDQTIPAEVPLWSRAHDHRDAACPAAGRLHLDFLRPALGHDYPPVGEFDRRRYRLGLEELKPGLGDKESSHCSRARHHKGLQIVYAVSRSCQTKRWITPVSSTPNWRTR